MSRLYRSVLILLLFIMSACSQGSTIPDDRATATSYEGGIETAPVSMAQTVEAGSSPTPIATFTPVTLPTFSLSTNALPTVSFTTPTPSIRSTPTTTPTAVVLPANFSPVLLGKNNGVNTFFSLLGGVQAGKWLSADEAVAQITGASLYDVYAFTNGMHLVYGYAPAKSTPFSPGYYLSTDADLNEAGMLGVAHGWQVTQRAVDELLFQNELYQQVVTDWLSQAGVADPQTGTMHIYRVDLEGDGTDEIFISDTLVESQHTAGPGDHSIILMRKVVGKEAVTIPILVDLYMYAKTGGLQPFPCSYSITNFIDLNQDGVLDVMVEFGRWEGSGASLYEIDGETVEQVLGHTCITP